MISKFLRCLLFSFLGVSGFVFAERYEIENYIVDVEIMCAEGDLSCQDISVIFLSLNDCYYFRSKGVALNSKKDFDFYGYQFYQDGLSYNLYPRGDVTLEILKDS